jgi:hypothetical protein
MVSKFYKSETSVMLIWDLSFHTVSIVAIIQNDILPPFHIIK